VDWGFLGSDAFPTPLDAVHVLDVALVSARSLLLLLSGLSHHHLSMRSRTRCSGLKSGSVCHVHATNHGIAASMEEEMRAVPLLHRTAAHRVYGRGGALRAEDSVPGHSGYRAAAARPVCACV